MDTIKNNQNSFRCCGKEHETAFCPMCGKRLAVSAEQGLLTYLKANLNSKKTELETVQRPTYKAKLKYRYSDRLNDSQIDERQNQAIEKKKRLVQKWQAWVDWVSGKIAPEKDS